MKANEKIIGLRKLINEYINEICHNTIKKHGISKSILKVNGLKDGSCSVTLSGITAAKITVLQKVVRIRTLKSTFFKINNKLKYNQYFEKDDYIHLEIENSYVFDDKIKIFLNNIEHLICNTYENLSDMNTFGCCSRYQACSDVKHCIHPDQIHAKGCHYRKNLENGRIFYGINKNI